MITRTFQGIVVNLAGGTGDVTVYSQAHVVDDAEDFNGPWSKVWNAPAVKAAAALEQPELNILYVVFDGLSVIEIPQV